MWWSKFYFDKQDYELLGIVNAIVAKRNTAEAGKSLFDTSLHPHGIKTLALTREIRVAHAVARLIDSLEVGDSQNRLHALRALYDEVLHSARTNFRRNTARVLIEIMKEMLRSHGNLQHQLYLASDFRRAARGTPLVVRELLAHYGLIEMPEDWSQLSFDHHVHDANTKGRKNPTHLIMDAWLRGIQQVTIIYYNYIEEDAAREVLRAAEIVGIKAHIGFEFSVAFRNKYAYFVWSPHNTENISEFLEFLHEPPMRHLMELGRKASSWRQKYVFQILDAWNNKHRFDLASKVGIDAQSMGTISHENFRQFVGAGQPSTVHLAECIHTTLIPILQWRETALGYLLDSEDENVRNKAKLEEDVLKQVSSASIYSDYMAVSKNPDILPPYVPSDDPDVPELLHLKPIALLDWLTSIYPRSVVTLSTARLNCEDVLELLWICQGLITHLEVFNIREWKYSKSGPIDEILQLQHALNESSLPHLKHVVLAKLREREKNGPAANEDIREHEERCAAFRDILGNIQIFKNFYTASPLWTRMGSDATGRPESDIGMGLVFPGTLPRAAQKVIEKQKEDITVPFSVTMQYNMRFTPSELVSQKSLLTRIIRCIPGMRYYGYTKEKEWCTRSSSARHVKDGNIVSLGNIKRKPILRRKPKSSEKTMPSPVYLNSRLSNILKVLVGFIPAVLTFQYTQSWWFLAWFGPIIWFGITGVRNIVQAIVAGGGFYRSTLLRWNDYVSWSRLSDSLMYTGFSVPLLEIGVRLLLLQEGLGYTVADHAVVVYSVMGIVNGLYIAWHNIIRGLPQEAIIGNLFRSALAIPMAVLYSGVALETLILLNIANPYALIQMSSAIISKMASDTVAALVEGYADHKNNVRMRIWDYETKFKQIFNNYTNVELQFPEDDVLLLIVKPKRFLKQLSLRNADLRQAVIINALDFMYFWLYQQRSQEVCKRYLAKMSKEERQIFGYMQLVLTREQEVSRLFVDGMLGRHFAKPLAIYLQKYKIYLREILPLCSMDNKSYEQEKIT